MTSKTNEQALESAIEKRLTGTCLEEQSPLYSSGEERADLYRAVMDTISAHQMTSIQSMRSMKHGSGVFCRKRKRMNWPNCKSRVTGN